jgi:hypothetical protein
MADDIVQLVDDSTNTGEKVDVSKLTVGANTVNRQRVNLADPSAAASIMAVKAASTAAALTDPAAVVALSPNSPVTKAKFRSLSHVQQSIKASAGVLFGVQIVNNQGAACYVQIFDAAAGVTLGTDEPVMEFLVPANTQVNVPLPAQGVAFGTGIRVASTTTEMGSTGSAAGVMLFAQYV